MTAKLSSVSGNSPEGPPVEPIGQARALNTLRSNDRRTLALSAEVALFIAVVSVAFSIAGALPVAWYWRLLIGVGLTISGLVLVGYHAGRISGLVQRTLRPLNDHVGPRTRNRPAGEPRIATFVRNRGRALDLALYVAGTAAFAGAGYIVTQAVR